MFCKPVGNQKKTVRPKKGKQANSCPNYEKWEVDEINSMWNASPYQIWSFPYIQNSQWTVLKEYYSDSYYSFSWKLIQTRTAFIRWMCYRHLTLCGKKKQDENLTKAYLASGCKASDTAFVHSGSFGVSLKKKASLLRSSSWKLKKGQLNVYLSVIHMKKLKYQFQDHSKLFKMTVVFLQE